MIREIPQKAVSRPCSPMLTSQETALLRRTRSSVIFGCLFVIGSVGTFAPQQRVMASNGALKTASNLRELSNRVVAPTDAIALSSPESISSQEIAEELSEKKFSNHSKSELVGASVLLLEEQSKENNEKHESTDILTSSKGFDDLKKVELADTLNHITPASIQKAADLEEVVRSIESDETASAHLITSLDDGLLSNITPDSKSSNPQNVPLNSPKLLEKGLQDDSIEQTLDLELDKFKEESKAVKQNSDKDSDKDAEVLVKGLQDDSIEQNLPDNSSANSSAEPLNESSSHSLDDKPQEELSDLPDQDSSSEHSGLMALKSLEPSVSSELSPEDLVLPEPANRSGLNLINLPIAAVGPLPRLPELELPPLKSENYLPSQLQPGGKVKYIWPAKGTFTSGYGWRWGRMHRGIDVAAPVGTPIVASAPGVVTYSQFNDGGYGNLVEVKHPDGSLTLYAHNHLLRVRVGQFVSQGQQIADMGSTGRSTGPHLHFELHPAGKGAINPVQLLTQG